MRLAALSVIALGALSMAGPRSALAMPDEEVARVLAMDEPPPGVVYYYMVRPTIPFVGSWGPDASGTERTSPCF